MEHRPEELAAAARACTATRPDPALRERAAAAIAAVHFANADPAVALSHVIWPGERVLNAQAAARSTRAV